MLKLQVKGKEILKRSGEKNIHRLSLKARVSYPSADRLINKPDQQQTVDLSILAHLLTDGLDLTPQQVLDLPMSAFFEIVETDRSED